MFLCCVWTYSLDSLNVSTFLNPTTCDCCLKINNLDAHAFHLSCDASGDIWASFLMLLMFPSLLHEGMGLRLAFLPPSTPVQKELENFPGISEDFLAALGYFPSSPRFYLLLHCNSNASPGTQYTWGVGHLHGVIVHRRECWCGVSLCSQQVGSKLVSNEREELGCWWDLFRWEETQATGVPTLHLGE